MQLNEWNGVLNAAIIIIAANTNNHTNNNKKNRQAQTDMYLYCYVVGKAVPIIKIN